MSEYCSIKRLTGFCCLKDRRGLGAKTCGWPLEATKGKKMDSLLEFPERISPAKTLI